MGADDVEDDAYRLVVGAIARVDKRVARRVVGLETSLVADLGIDSLRFVDLAFALEQAFSIAVFPLQDWYDAEVKREGAHFTIGSLVDACKRAQRTEGVPGMSEPTSR